MIKINYKKVLSLLMFSIPSTLLNVGILFILSTFFTKDIDAIPNYTVPVFFLFIVYSYLINILFQTELVKYNYFMVYGNEVQVLKILHNKSLIAFEKYGSEKFYNILEDLRVFVFFPNVLTATFNSVLTICICLSYLFWKSSITTIILFVFILFFVGFYIIMNKKMVKEYEKLRLFNEDYYKFIDDSIKGFKEFKISKIKTHIFFNKYLVPNRQLAEKSEVKITTKFLLINQISQYALYLILGFLLLLIIYFKMLNHQEVVTYVVCLLFLNGPISSLISMQSFYAKVMASGKRIKLFFKDFETPDIKSMGSRKDKIQFENLFFENVSFRYNKENNEDFVLENIQFKVERGEVIFIVGGNGSGKSTFINVLTGLYQPAEGQIYLNNNCIQNQEDSYKELFSVIYTDNYLFSKNYNDYTLEGNEKYTALLKMMEMDKVINDDHDNSVRRKFSKGQSKRMAMIFALLENKPILVLDEWAADQDPHFRKYFYEVLIPSLKKDGKTIIAVTHDDKYFNHADRIIKFDYGKIVKDIPVKEKSLTNII